MPGRLKRRARLVRRDVHALWLAARDPRTPFHARVLALGTAAHALSPLDLVPDLVPVPGHREEALLLPLAILLAGGAVMVVALRVAGAAALAERRPRTAFPITGAPGCGSSHGGSCPPRHGRGR